MHGFYIESFFISKKIHQSKGVSPMVRKDEEVYSKIIERYSKDVYKICFYLTKDKKEAGDLTIKVFLDFYDVYESVIGTGTENIEERIESTEILRILRSMIPDKLKAQQ